MPGLCMQQQQQQQHFQEKADMTLMGLCRAQQVKGIPLCRQKLCPLGSTKILPELDMRCMGRKGRSPCFRLKQHTHSQASMFTVFIAVLGLSSSQSHLEGSCVWDGLWVVIPTSVTLACKDVNLC